ncbi:MAG: peptide deformylase [bacterium]
MKKQLSIVEEIPTSNDVVNESLFEIYKYSNKMEKICIENNILGLAASQVGIPLNFFVFKNQNIFECYLNCSYEGIGEEYKSIESCLNFKNKNKLRRFEMQRHFEIKVSGKKMLVYPSISLENFSETKKGVEAVVFAQLIDLQNGKFISKLGKELEIYVE